MLFNDKKFVNEMIAKISFLGIGVEKLCGCEQDIEGLIIIMNFWGKKKIIFFSNEKIRIKKKLIFPLRSFLKVELYY